MEETKYWKGLEELNADPGFLEERDKEFSDELPVEEVFNSQVVQKSQSRRDFLKMLGFSVSAATLAASCRIPVKKAIPYVIMPEEVIPGVANYYASTFCDGNDYCPVLIKVRDGRPVKVEPLTSRHIGPHSPHRFLFGGTSARAQASVLSLYDMSRPQNPTVQGKKVAKADVSAVDGEIRKQLQEIKTKGGQIRMLTSTVVSPSTQSLIAEFAVEYPTSKQVIHDPVSYAALALAHEKLWGTRAVPGYHFENAKVIVSIAADFLGTWISPTEFARQYVQNRKVSAEKPEMSQHFHLESRLSLTGSNADYRTVIKPSEEGAAVVSLYNKLAAKLGASQAGTAKLNDQAEHLITRAAEVLASHPQQSLVVAGSNDTHIQTVVAAINQMLGSYGSTISMVHHSRMHQSQDAGVNELLAEMNAGSISALIVYGANPVYDHRMGTAFGDALKKVPLTISLSDRADETTALCKYHLPDHHYLESWNDFAPRNGLYTLCQPAIWPLFNTRQAQESLLKMLGRTEEFSSYIQNYWKATVFPNQSAYADFQTFWNNSLKEGAFELSLAGAPPAVATGMDVVSAASAALAYKAEGLEVVFYEKVGLGNGRYANNPWLQELPDPVSKVVWDNYICVSPKYAKEHNLVMETKEHWSSLVNLKIGDQSVDLPVYVMPGHHDECVSVALGYGRTKAGRAGNGVGANVYPMLRMQGETTGYYQAGAVITATGSTYPIAATQTHYSYEGRDAVKETSLAEYQLNPHAEKAYKEHLREIWDETLYPEQEFPAIKWGMSIDLNSCIGCGACAVSCQAENNVPVVGKTEVRRVHEMTWLRIDRYFSFPTEGVVYTKENDIKPDDISHSKVTDFQNVRVTFAPMLCQHCENAPCENVCPVNATNHSTEGLNQMAYNRCIGTRYCANNCPYKVRRFNWLDYTTADVFPWNEPWKIPTLGIEDTETTDAISRMVLNPDVTVRSRGVMEKCSFCVQRLQEAKLEAKKAGVPVTDGVAKTACQTACPTEAIAFGNLRDSQSRVYKDHEDGRGYYVLADLNTRPSISYMKKVRNIEGAPSAEQHAQPGKEATHG